MDTSLLLRETRKAARLSQASLAKKAGTSQSAVARYESGAASPSIRTLERLMLAMGKQLVLSTQSAMKIPKKPSVISGRMKHLRTLRGPIQRAVREAGAKNIRVFGSVARGEDDRNSDIDLLVDFDVHTEGALPLIRLQRTLEELTGEQIEIATLELLRPHIAKRALSEAVTL